MTGLKPPSSCRWLSLGLSERDEFRPLWREISQTAGTAACQQAATLSVFFQETTSAPLAFAVVWQSRPDEFTSEDVSRLLHALPLCRVVCVAGAWCESDQRTRRSWPPALVVPWWRAGPRLKREWELAHQPSGSILPWTASREETWLWDETTRAHRRLTGIAVSIQVSDPALARMISEYLVAADAHLADTASGDVVLVDADPWSEERAQQLAEAVARCTPATVIALSAWTTPDLLACLSRLGIAAVCPKLDPALLADMIHDTIQPNPLRMARVANT